MELCKDHHRKRLSRATGLTAAPLNSKSCDDTSFKTLHLFLKIKVLRRPVEATAQT
jgi:hypothetical protein